jgi:4-amino-4-deoxy-L-arabinose transferase-like glycosyltransferase
MAAMTAIQPIGASLSKGVSAWIPYIWSCALFPGHADQTGRVRLSALAILILLPAVLLYPTRSFPLLEPDEGRYAQIAREMLLRGEWVVPTLQGEPYLDKPPLLYWLTRISYSLFGVSETSARLFPALAVHGAILIVYLIGRRSLGERSAFWGALLLSVAPGFVGMGRLLLLDGLLTVFVTLSIFSAFEAVRTAQFRRGWWLLAAAACGLGTLTKGPIALVLLAPPLVINRWLTGQGAPIGWRRIILFLGIVFLVNLPWYVGIYLRAPAFLRYFFWEQNVMRFLQPFDHPQPVWYYLPIVLGGLLPGTLLLWGFGRYLCATEEETAAKRSPALGFWLLSGLWCVAFFSMSGCKLPTYILPAFPCLTLVLGDFIAHSKWQRTMTAKAGVAITAGFLAFVHFYALPWYALQRSPMADPGLLAHYCGDPHAAIVCFPRNVDSVAFYLERDDLRNVRTKESQKLVEDMLTRPRTVVLFTHRHSLRTLKEVLPPRLKITETTTLQRSHHGGSLVDKLAGDSPWGLCDLAVIERVQ